MNAALRLGAAFLCGAVIGAAAVVPWAGAQVDRLRLERAQLLLAVGDLEARWEALRQQLQQRDHRVVRSVRIDWGEIPEGPIRLAVQRELEPQLQELIGREVSRLDPRLLAALFAQRRIQVEDRAHLLRLRYLVVGEELWLAFALVREPLQPGRGS